MLEAAHAPKLEMEKSKIWEMPDPVVKDEPARGVKVAARLQCEVDPVVVEVVETLPVVEDEDVDPEVEPEVEAGALEQMVLRTETETPAGTVEVLAKRAMNPALTVLPMGRTASNEVKEY